MPRPKSKSSSNGVKRERASDAAIHNVEKDRPSKKTKLLDDTDSEDSDDVDDGGVSLKINEEYARRFEHNNKRAEKHRCMFRQTKCY